MCSVSKIALLTFGLFFTDKINSYGVFQAEPADPNQCTWTKLTSFNDTNENTCFIGPPCTMGVHNDFDDCTEDCQDASQRPDGPLLPGVPFNSHEYSEYFEMDFVIYFIKDDTNSIPFSSGKPPGTLGVDYERAFGKTYYDINVGGGFMRETYRDRCLPIFPSLPLNETNEYSCDFYTLNNNNTAYTVFHDDKPEGAPDCCVIGNPFRAPPQDFYENLPRKYQFRLDEATRFGDVIDVRDAFVTNGNLGNVSYGFFNDYYYDNATDTTHSVPHVFIFLGGPWLFHWCYQRFENFTVTKPAASSYQLPDSCLEDDVTWCPGWDPFRVKDFCPFANSASIKVAPKLNIGYILSFMVLWTYFIQ